jgi:hypothetical protein
MTVVMRWPTCSKLVVAPSVRGYFASFREAGARHRASFATIRVFPTTHTRAKLKKSSAFYLGIESNLHMADMGDQDWLAIDPQLSYPSSALTISNEQLCSFERYTGPIRQYFRT